MATLGTRRRSQTAEQDTEQDTEQDLEQETEQELEQDMEQQDLEQDLEQHRPAETGHGDMQQQQLHHQDSQMTRSWS